MSYEREINPPSFYLDTDDEFCKNKKCGVELWPSNSKNGYCLCCIEEEKADRGRTKNERRYKLATY